MFTKILSNKLTLSLLKWLIILFLFNLFAVDPIVKGLSKSINELQDKAIVKIISLDLLSNPLSFIQMASLAIENNKLDNAELYLNYAEVLEARYNYPPRLKKQISELRAKIQQAKNQ